jgi:hypothetical protein
MDYSRVEKIYERVLKRLNKDPEKHISHNKEIVLQMISEALYENISDRSLSVSSKINKEKLRLYDTVQMKWLYPTEILFGKKGEIRLVQACEIGGIPAFDGTTEYRGEDLDRIGIKGDIRFNTHLLPNDKKNLEELKILDTLQENI